MPWPLPRIPQYRFPPTAWAGEFPILPHLPQSSMHLQAIRRQAPPHSHGTKESPMEHLPRTPRLPPFFPNRRPTPRPKQVPRPRTQPLHSPGESARPAKRPRPRIAPFPSKPLGKLPPHRRNARERLPPASVPTSFLHRLQKVFFQHPQVPFPPASVPPLLFVVFPLPPGTNFLLLVGDGTIPPAQPSPFVLQLPWLRLLLEFFREIRSSGVS